MAFVFIKSFINILLLSSKSYGLLKNFQKKIEIPSQLFQYCQLEMVKVICCKPLDTPLKEHFIDNHSVLRIIYYNKRKKSENEPTRAQLIGMEFVAIAVGLFLCFILKGTDPVCRMQDICFEGCKAENGECEGVKDPNAEDMKTYDYLNKTGTTIWNDCYNTAIEWKNNGTRVCRLNSYY